MSRLQSSSFTRTSFRASRHRGQRPFAASATSATICDHLQQDTIPKKGVGYVAWPVSLQSLVPISQCSHNSFCHSTFSNRILAPNHTSQPASHMSSLAGLVPPPRVHFHSPTPTLLPRPRPRPTARISATSPPHLFHKSSTNLPRSSAHTAFLSSDNLPSCRAVVSAPEEAYRLLRSRRPNHPIPNTSLHTIRHMNQ